MLRRAVITLVVAGTIAAPATGAPIRGQTLMSGVVYAKQIEFTAHGPVALNVVSAPRPSGLYSIRAWLSNGAVQGRERLTDMENGISATATVLGVNGDFFDTRWGTPSSVLMRGGVLGAGTKGGRSAAGFDAGGGLHVDRMSFDGSWKGTGQFRPLGLNEPPGRSNVTLYTPAWGTATPAESGTVEAILAPFPATRPNVTLTAPVTQLVQGGNQAIPANGVVLVARGPQVQTLTTEAPAGGTVAVRLILTPRWNDVREAVGGGPVLVRNGRPVFRANESFTTSQLFTRTARSAVGQTADGRLLFLTADGGRPGYSSGMTSFELALAMMRFGAVSACGLGTGAPAALAFDGKLLSRPSDLRGESPVADALLFLYEGVFSPVPAPTVALGKTQALAYKVVRRSTVTARLSGPSGTTTLDAGARDPGTYKFDWTATAEGRWTFSVDAVDDLGRASGTDRTFTVGASSKRG
ncbi:MAG: phosphodiester glycosidase family protein [Gaiellaceae bacterium]